MTTKEILKAERQTKRFRRLHEHTLIAIIQNPTVRAETVLAAQSELKSRNQNTHETK